MIWLICIFSVIMAYVFIPFRLALLHPFKTIKNGFVDFYKIVLYHDWNRCKKAELICYQGLFGMGKTLSVVYQTVFKDFKKYNNKKVYDIQRKQWVVQKVRILSNVYISGVGGNFEYMKTLGQIVRFAEKQAEIDKEEGTLTCLFCIIDEASVMLNNRSYRDNIDYGMLNTLLTSRHHHICGIYTTSQRFHLEDKLLRDVTQRVVNCRKIWRFQVNYYYDAWEMENAVNPTLVRPIKRTGFFATDSVYNAYNTYAVVEELQKATKEGTMMTDAEILALRGVDSPDMDRVIRPSRKYIRKNKKQH